MDFKHDHTPYISNADDQPPRKRLAHTITRFGFGMAGFVICLGLLVVLLEDIALDISDTEPIKYETGLIVCKRAVNAHYIRDVGGCSCIMDAAINNKAINMRARKALITMFSEMSQESTPRYTLPPRQELAQVIKSGPQHKFLNTYDRCSTDGFSALESFDLRP